MLENQALKLESIIRTNVWSALLSPTVGIMGLEKSDVQRDTKLRLHSADMVFGGQRDEDAVSAK